MSTEVRRSTIALVVLALLKTVPMHMYEIQLKIRQWHKDDVINVRQRSSLYRTIERLQAGGLVEVLSVERAEARPERTVYALTDRGRDVVREWQLEMLAVPAAEYPEFPAALSLVAVLEVDEAIDALARRLDALTAKLDRLDADVAMGADHGVPRLFMVETEYQRAVLVAERSWVVSLLDELRSGELTWDEQWLRDTAARFAELEREGGLPELH